MTGGTAIPPPVTLQAGACPRGSIYASGFLMATDEHIPGYPDDYIWVQSPRCEVFKRRAGSLCSEDDAKTEPYYPTPLWLRLVRLIFPKRR